MLVITVLLRELLGSDRPPVLLDPDPGFLPMWWFLELVEDMPEPFDPDFAGIDPLVLVVAAMPLLSAAWASAPPARPMAKAPASAILIMQYSSR